MKNSEKHSSKPKEENSIPNAPIEDEKELKTKFSRSQVPLPPTKVCKSSSEEDPDYNEKEFAELRKQINADCGLTEDEIENSRFTTVSAYTEISENDDKSKLKRYLRKCCFCCRKGKNSRVSTIEGMNEVEDRVEETEEGNYSLSKGLVTRSEPFPKPTPGHHDLPSSANLMRRKTKKKVKFVGILDSKSCYDLKEVASYNGKTKNSK